MVQTVVKQKYVSEKLVLRAGLSEETISFEVYGQTTDRSYEDRSVFINFSNGHGWLQGEDAIMLGQLLIKHGTNALMANMINHQLIHESQRLKKFIDEGRVNKVVMTVVDENPANYGEGFRTYHIQPEFKKGKVPDYHENFSFEHVIYWSPIDEEFKDQMDAYGGNVEFIGYDRQAELVAFDRFVAEMN